jgi:hypothetical protein
MRILESQPASDYPNDGLVDIFTKRISFLGGCWMELENLFGLAKPPEGVGEHKYDHSAGAMVALLKYGAGLPFNRLENLQGDLGIPLPASTQWEIVEKVADHIYPAYEEMVRQAAQGELFFNDDTTMKIPLPHQHSVRG